MSSGSEMEFDEDMEYEKEIEAAGSDQFDQSDINDGVGTPTPLGYGESQPKKMVIQQNENDRACATYVFLDEDHTLGNALRYVLIHRPDVEFCGYSLPHPSENKMNLRIQTITSTTTEAVLNSSLDTLSRMCDIIQNKFKMSLQ